MVELALFVPFSFGRGVERVNVTLAKALAQRGIEVDVVVARRDGPYFDELDGKVRVVDLAADRTLASLPRLATYLRRVRPRAVLSAPDSGSLVALWAQWLARVDSRMVVVTHAVLSQSLGRKSAAYRRTFPRLLHRTYPRADAIVAVSEQVKEDLIRVAGLTCARIQVIPNPVVHDRMLDRACAGTAHPWLQEGRSAPVVLSVGRLHEEKNYSDLVHAFARLRRERPARLIILGDGAERDRLASIAREVGVADDVDLPGFVANPYGHMAQADLFALSSRYEALPTVLIEAMACGCPIVATDCPGGVREILEDGRHGRLVPVGDVAAMARAMLETLDSPANPEQLRQRAMDFHVDRIVERYREVLGV